MRRSPWRTVNALLALCCATGSAAAPAIAAPVRGETIGPSVENRPLRLVRIGDPQALRRVLVVGCIHGTERAGIAIAKRLRAVEPPPGTQLLVLDALNPDRCFGRRRERGNAGGVDLNRNFPRGWRALDGIFESGPRPSSEPETRAFVRLVLRERPSVTITYHQALGWVDLQRGAKLSLMRRYAREAGMRTTRTTPLPGTAARWQNHRLPGRSAFVVELPRGAPSFAAIRRHRRAVIAMLDAVAPPAARVPSPATEPAAAPRAPTSR